MHDSNTPSDWIALFPAERRPELENALLRAVRQNGLTRAADLIVWLSLRYRSAAACPISPDAERLFAISIVERLRSHRELALVTFAPFLTLRPQSDQRRRGA
ncbi:MAG: hypothetical protein ACO1SX_21890 [Actinomycetota bacterium]